VREERMRNGKGVKKREEERKRNGDAKGKKEWE
jgi:hypothetical protein